MPAKRPRALLSLIILALLPAAVLSQVPPNVMPANIFEILDPAGTRLGTVLVAAESSRGFEAGTEYWRFSEAALVAIGEQESLEFAVLATGEWSDPWVVEALGWWPGGDAVEWSHPAAVAWTAQEESRPPVVPGGTYFGNATLGGLTIAYSPRGASSLTWFKLTEGPYMLIGEGAVFVQDEDVPETGSWWQGST